MSSGMNKYCETLELNKILNLLSKKTSCDDSKKLVKKITPLTDLKAVNNLLKETSDAHMLIARFGAPNFSGLNNMQTAIKKATSGGTLTTIELLKIADNIHVFNFVQNFKEQFETINTVLDAQFSGVISNKYLENRIKTCIISEDEIADEASSELLAIRRKINRISDSIREQLEKMIRSSNIQKYLQENIITVKSERFVLPVRTEFRKEIPGLVHETSASGATLFIEPASVVDLNNEIKILRQKEKNEIEKILKSLSIEVADFAENLLNSYAICVNLDVIFAKALLAYDMKAVLPKVNNRGKIILKKARHPLVESQKVVPTNISLGESFDSLIITGPNTGGKTVLLKTVGLFVLMTMCGLMIPASEKSEISIFDHVLADIGDEQSIEQSLSTFSSHIINIVEILSVANKNSLVLLDELGAGTDPVEGAALAIAIVETLKEKGCRIISTTHYAELKEYALVSDGVENASCEFDVKTLKPTYNLLMGIPGSSNAFAIAKRLGVPYFVIKKAQKLVNGETKDFENVLKQLELTRKNLEEERLNLQKMKQQLVSDLNFVEKEKEILKKRKQDELNKTKSKAENILYSAKIMAEELIEEIKNIKKLKLNNDDSVRKLNYELNRIDEIIDPVEAPKNSNYKLPRKLKLGDEVLIFDIDKKGTVLEISSDEKLITVQAGIIKTRVPIDNIRLLSEKKSQNKSHISGVVKASKRNKLIPVTREIDVRGKTALEATLELDKFIDNAVLSKVNTLTIIHGKGSGVLRSEIAKYLKKHPNVKTFRLGTFGEGESGVTIVDLK